MSSNPPMLHLVCGKIASGKSTLTAKLGGEPGTIVVSEDQWLSRLYPGEQNSLEDYVRNAGRLRAVMEPHLLDLLGCGVSVVLDFPANTLANRAWMKALVHSAGCGHQLHHLDVPDELCKARLRQRNASGQHEFTVSEKDFDLISSYFVAPRPDEGFDVVVHRP